MSSDSDPELEAFGRIRVLPVKHTYSRLGRPRKTVLKPRTLQCFKIPISCVMTSDIITSDSCSNFGSLETSLEDMPSDPPPLLGIIEELRTPLRKRYYDVEHKLIGSKKPKLLPQVQFPISSINQVNKMQMVLQNQMYGDDDEGHLNFNIGDIVGHYDLLGFLGKGTFGRVAKARNLKTCQIVALKIVRNTEGCREGAKNEALVLNLLKKLDPEGKHLWIKMYDYFEFQGHICIAFEKLGDSLYAFMKENRHQPFQLPDIRHIAYQLCYSVKALHDFMIIHTDLKPENICFVSSDFKYGIRTTRQQTYRKPLNTNIRIIDFGSALDFSEDRNFVIQTRYYRAPEVLFGLKWNQAVDIWSIGCILFELYTGECLFVAHDDDEHYNVLMDVLGPFPRLYLSTKLAKKHVDLDSLEHKRKSRKHFKKSMHMSTKEHHEFFDLMEKMLQYNPEERLSLTAALKHPFFMLLSDDQKLKY